MTTSWIVVAAVVVVGLAAAFVHDRRAAGRAQRDGRVAGGAASGGALTRGVGDPEAYRSSPGTHPDGWGRGTGV